MDETDTSENRRLPAAAPFVVRCNGPAIEPEADSALLVLEAQFNVLAAELAAILRARGESVDAEVDQEGRTRQVEAILARLDPIERAIMQTPARTIAGLGVKARHVAYVTSEYWSAPIDRIDWDAQAVRLLIEAVCNVGCVSLPFDAAGNIAP